MADHPLPPVFRYLVDEPNRAVDETLVAALPRLEPFPQAVAVELLVRRRDERALAELAGRFPPPDDVLRALVVAHAGQMRAGIQSAIRSGKREHVRGAIELIAEADEAACADLLAEALGHDSEQVRARAGEVLHRLVENAVRVTSSDTTGDGAKKAESARRRTLLTEAVARAVRRWETHRHPAVAEAALLLEDEAEPFLRAKLEAGDSSLLGAIVESIERRTDGRLAGWVFRGMSIDTLSPRVERLFHRVREPAFLQALADQAWLLADERIARAFRRIALDRWAQRWIGLLPELTDSQAARAVRMLCLASGTAEERMQLLRPLIETQRASIRRAAVWNLVEDEREPSSDLLLLVAIRRGDPLARVAERELRRRERSLRAALGARASARRADDPEALAVEAALNAYWSEPPGKGDSLADRLARWGRDKVQEVLEIRLHADEPLDRLRSLVLLRELGWAKEMETAVFRLASDPNAVVRGLAVGMLAAIPGATSERLLKTAARDPDARTRANAIEALDRKDVPDRKDVTMPALEGSPPRVRANAVRSLLRMEVAQAGQTLLAMLQDPSPAQRLSALWVVERFCGRALMERLRRLAERDTDPRVRRRATRILAAVAAGTSARPASPVT
ncbi:MAG: hypothetical protein D6788_11590 [Planctomycetota bacterium]|nr:MAG: hypothetical protein D6788_11590 [Planctomycetota bacterium]